MAYSAAELEELRQEGLKYLASLNSCRTETEYSQKDAASILERAAQRAHSVNAEPASSKQCWFLAGLMIKAGDHGDIGDMISDTSLVLTKRKVSSMIDGMLIKNRAN